MRALALAFLILLAVGSAAFAVDLTVRFDGVERRGGSLRVGLFASAEGFARRQQGVIARRVVATDGDDVVVRFEGLVPGRYAVTAFHDVNDNRRLDRAFGLLPLEGVALSNDPPLVTVPSFDDLALEVSAPREVRVRLRYLGG